MAATGRPRTPRRTGAGILAVGAVVALVVAGCGGGSGGRGTGLALAAHPAAAPTSTTTAPPVTEEAPSTTTSTTAPLPGLGPGAKGATVAALEARLTSLHYEVGAVDDTYDQDTAYGVMAFQKVTGMARTGRATDDVVAAVDAAKPTPPPPLVPAGGANRVEVDLARQVLFLYEGGNLAKILTVSTGSGVRFCSQGYCRNAITDPGSFSVYRQAHGWEHGPLGDLYNPAYFDGGIAIHGSPSVPASPASHGCVRIPMHAAEWFPSHISLGTPVYVAGTDGSIPAPVPTTTTTPPTTTPPTTPATTPAPTTPVPTPTSPASTSPPTTVPKCLLVCPPAAPKP
ncbi:MAG: L,D-transpeptidase [Acidimicrobiales bacterium]